MNRLIDLIKKEGSPLIDGEQVTFVWKGSNPPQLMGDFTDWERGEPLILEKYEENIWIKRINFPLDAYLEYVFVRHGRRVLDPNNHNLTPNGFGRYNHYFYMPEYTPTMLATYWPGLLRGRLTSHTIPTWELVGGNKRKVYLYRPAENKPTPLIVVLDGQDYLWRARLPAIIDNLITRKIIRPVSLALVENNKRSRMAEYGCSEANLFFLSEVVLPLAHEWLNLINILEFPGTFGMLGASMGGLMAFYTSLRMPEVFGKVLVQSGGFSLEDRETVVFDLVNCGIAKTLKIWMEAGNFDIRTLLGANLRMAELLSANGYDVVSTVYNAGHNYPAWRDRIGRGLVHLFGI